MDIPSKKTINILIVVVFTICYASWILVIKPARQKSRDYRGEIVEVYRKGKWMRSARGPLDGSQYRNYLYYWKIKCPDGTIQHAEVPWTYWKTGEEGLPVIKIEGERYPFIDTPEAARKREDDRKALEMVFGKK